MAGPPAMLVRIEQGCLLSKLVRCQDRRFIFRFKYLKFRENAEFHADRLGSVEQLATTGRCGRTVLFISLDDVRTGAPAMYFIRTIDQAL